MKPMQFEVSDTEEFLVSHSGLALVGALIQRGDLASRVNAVDAGHRREPAVSHADVVSSMVGLLCLAKPDFTRIQEFQDDEFFLQSLGLATIPSEATLRQRLDELGSTECGQIAMEEAVAIVARHAPLLSPCLGKLVALDVDVTAFDNSDTKKEGVSRTYQKVDGYAPIFAYVGEEGYLVDCELREGRQHSQRGTPEFLRRAIKQAKRVLGGTQRLVVRLDAGFDAETTLRACRLEKVDWIIKRNIRQESPEEWEEIAQAYGEYSQPREGKEVYVGSTWIDREGRGQRVIFEVERRTIDENGQPLLLPDVEIATYWTSLKLAPTEIIDLYRQHATSEQFHSEIKTDLDLERLPSGKFATNALILRLGALAYNLLRLCGQEALRRDRKLPPEQRMPVRKKGHRRRLRQVIQDFVYMASRLIRHARRSGIRFWSGNRWRVVWKAVYAAFTAA